MRIISRVATFVLAAAAMLAVAAPAAAKTYEVTKTGDAAPGNCTPNDCSLREAVLAANDRAGADTIVLPNARRSYKLTIANTLPTGEDGGAQGDLDVTNDRLTIEHRGDGRATIDQRVPDRVLHAFERLTLKRIAVTGGDLLTPPGGDGGGILTTRRLMLIRSAVRNNVADDAGGIQLADTSSIRLERSVLRGNRADDDGGAIRFSAVPAGPNLVSRTRFVENRAEGNPSAHGGAIDVSEANVNVTVQRSTFKGNRAEEVGGAINHDNPGGLFVIRSKFANNRSLESGGALHLQGPVVEISRSTIAGNRAAEDGGGIYGLAGEIKIATSTISRNRATAPGTGGNESGGGLYFDGPTVKIVNSTVAENRADAFGGGIHAQDGADLTLNAVTVAHNIGAADDVGVVLVDGGGLSRLASVGFDVRNSLVALNKVGAPGSRSRNDCAGDFDSLGHNLLSTRGPGTSCEGFDRPSDRVRRNPKIGQLANNGGPTKTIALRENSPAIGRAHKPTAPDRDQRGRKRDRRPDIGAFERGA